MFRGRLFQISTCVAVVAVALEAAVCVCFGAEQASAKVPADFQEVYELVRGHLPGITATELDQAALQGVLANLGSKLAVVAGSGSGAGASQTDLLVKTNVFEDSIGYLRIAQVEDGLAGAIEGAWGQFAEPNQLKGLVLDLRYAGGDDYPAAAAVASLFLSKEQPLLDFGSGLVQGKPVDHAIRKPVAVLVNAQTSGAAEALAAVLRETGAGLLLGSRTAGKAMMYREYPLKSGARLRLSSGPLRLGDGSQVDEAGITPDITVDVAAAEERAYYADAFRVVTNYNAGTLSSRRVRVNEAELARERREGVVLDVTGMRARRSEPEKPVVSDPALARALDLLKGLAVVRKPQT